MADVVEKWGTRACSKPALQQGLCVAVNVTVGHIPEVTQEQRAREREARNTT